MITSLTIYNIHFSYFGNLHKIFKIGDIIKLSRTYFPTVVAQKTAFDTFRQLLVKFDILFIPPSGHTDHYLGRVGLKNVFYRENISELL